MTETHVFKAEINQLMNLIVNAFYSEKEIFLRELISNASDALNRYKIRALQSNGALTEDDLGINIITDKGARTLTISDNGDGMTKEKLIDLLGTVAKSGTKEFMQALDEKNKDLIGKFGVGFYSAYLVADDVVVDSISCDEGTAHRWQSKADGSFTVTPIESDMSHGTVITLYLKESELEFLDTDVLEKVIKTHSNYVTFPINLLKTKEREVEVEEDAEDAPEGKVEEEKEKEKEKKMETYTEFEQVNSKKCIWQKSPNDVTPEEYDAFFKELKGGEYLTHKHFRTEGDTEYSCLLFVPQQAPFDILEDGDDNKSEVKLYNRQVYITDNCDDIIPKYLRFLVGVVDADIDLNVSREMTQNKKNLQKMGRYITKKVLETLSDLSEDKEKYSSFYSQYSTNLKLGIHEDDKNRGKLIDLLRFFTMNHKDERVSLSQYVSEMKEGQDTIYYITGQDVSAVDASPLLEAFKQHGYDVLFMVDNIDEYIIQKMLEYEKKKLVSVAKEGLKLKESDDVDEKAYEEFFKFLQTSLGSKVMGVKRSHTLVSTPFGVVAPSFGLSANMERIAKAQPLGKKNPGMEWMLGRRVLEVNVKHPLVVKMMGQFDSKDNLTELANIINLLYETASLTSGYSLDDVNSLANKLHKVVETGFDTGMFKDDVFKTDAAEADEAPPLDDAGDLIDTDSHDVELPEEVEEETTGIAETVDDPVTENVATTA